MSFTYFSMAAFVLTADMNSCDRDHVACKARYFYLAPYKTSFANTYIKGRKGMPRSFWAT